VEIQRFDTEFVRRTREILINYQGDFKLSNALNCLLGLVILPFEYLESSTNAYWDIDISQISELSFLNIQMFEPIQRIDRGTGTTHYYKKTLRNLIRKMRNGIAHQKIEPINRDGEFVGAIIRNSYNNINDTEIHFDNRRELEQFALFVADEYLKRA
jgi:HEPN pEK499 p136